MSALDRPSSFAIVEWLRRAAAAAQASAWKEPLTFDGVDLVDVLLNPLLLGALSVVRGESAAKAERFGLRERAYRIKKALAERLARLRSEQATPTDVLFWPRSPGHLEDMRAVWEALNQRGTDSRCLACQAWVFQSLRARGMKPVFAQAAWPDQIRTAHDDARRRAAALARLPGPDLAAIDPPSLSKVLAPYWRSKLVELLPEACVVVANARAALDRFRPKVVVIGNDVTPEGRAAALVAKRRHIPSLVIMHGHTGADNPMHAQHLADQFVAYGDTQRQALIKLGLADETIHVCGAPHLDGRPPVNDVVHPAVAKTFSIADGDPWVLVATSGPGNSISLTHHVQVIENLLKLSEALPDVTFVVKLHRKDDPRHYHGVMARHPGKHRLLMAPRQIQGGPGNILEWLRGCRAVLTGASTVAIEAMLMHVPVITMDFTGELKGISFIDAGATWHARSLADLETHLRHVLSADNGAEAAGSKAFLRDSFHALDGRSAERVADLLTSLAASSRPVASDG